MQLGLLEQIAQQIVDATAPLVGGRTINLMDCDGCIVASSDPARIGRLHPGAAQAAQSGASVSISRAELELYPGTREGVNLPVVRNGQTVCVVGIAGNPEEVQDAANLLGVCVGLYLDQDADAQRRQRRAQERRSLLRELLFEGADARMTGSAGAQKWPMQVLVMRVCEAGRFWRPERVEQSLVHAGLLDEARDLYGVEDGVLVLLLPVGMQDHGRACARFLTRVRDALAGEVVLAAGGLAANAAEVCASYQEACALGRLTRRGYADMRTFGGQRAYMMDAACGQGRMRMVRPLYEALERAFGEKDLTWIVESIRAYCEQDGSVTQAAELLHVHKNTLVYRMKKVLALLELEDEDRFTREFFLRLLLLDWDASQHTEDRSVQT